MEKTIVRIILVTLLGLAGAMPVPMVMNPRRYPGLAL